MARSPAVNTPYIPSGGRSSRPGGAVKAGSGISGTIELRGADELLKGLQELEPAIAKKILRTAMRQAATPILEEAKRRVPILTGQLRKSLKIRAIKRNNKGRIGVVISTEKGFFKGETFYGAFLEFGTKKMPAKPFIRPAFEANKARAVRIVELALKLGLDGVAKNLPKAETVAQANPDLLTPNQFLGVRKK